MYTLIHLILESKSCFTTFKYFNYHWTRKSPIRKWEFNTLDERKTQEW